MRHTRVALTAGIIMGLVAGTTTAAAAQDAGAEATEPKPFSGSLQAGGAVVGGYSPTMQDMTDPRLDGTVYYSGNGAASDHFEYGWHTYRIVNDSGAWQGSLPHLYVFDDADVFATTTGHLVGEGAYDGLLAIVELDFGGTESDAWTLSGVVVDADSVPAPPPPAGTE